jgi:iron(III) transport system substrate-binding protein
MNRDFCSPPVAVSGYCIFVIRRSGSGDVFSKIGFVWPNQKTTGVHINIAGGGVAKNAPHSQAAIQFLEYLASDSAQEYFANGNNEWPVVKSVKIENEGLKILGPYKAENISIAAIGKNQIAAQRLLDRVGYK